MLTKARFIKLNKLITHKLNVWYNHNFNTTVRSQLKDPKCIPIIIISFNQLRDLKQLVDFLLKHNYSNVVIVDNNSTYKPLLDYFEIINDKVTVCQLEHNIGHLSFWKSETIFKKYSSGYYVVTDADIVPVNGCPDTFMSTLRVLLDEAFDRTKVGFSLKLDDIPDTNPNKEKIKQWEAQFWDYKIKPKVFKAEIDTTFAMYRPNYSYQLKDFTKAWRTDFPLQARHGGWYLDINNLSDEQEYYMKTANASASWKTNKDGELINSTHKPLYTNE
ncbi:glycosyltransferase family 2 protein [uncultured Psychroserpens sp.]|uniref:glycosyltransferase family 2 protein n=1 Tax=uncultured Psychroserpens sp. TaxID=255436 RepID=UPI0026257394|nr:glycosyltransferase family 2 protein [uncultured Psychroserpens sp.]